MHIYNILYSAAWDTEGRSMQRAFFKKNKANLESSVIFFAIMDSEN
jgi:hypothetical protein